MDVRAGLQFLSQIIPDFYEYVKLATSSVTSKVKTKPIIRTSDAPIGMLSINGQLSKTTAESLSFSVPDEYNKGYYQTYAPEKERKSMLFSQIPQTSSNEVPIMMTKSIEPDGPTYEDLLEEEENYRVQKDNYMMGKAPEMVISEQDADILIIMLCCILTDNAKGYVDVTIEDLITQVTRLVSTILQKSIRLHTNLIEIRESLAMSAMEILKLTNIKNRLNMVIGTLSSETTASNRELDEANHVSDPYYNDAEHLWVGEPQFTGSLNTFGTEYHEILRGSLRNTRETHLNMMDRERTQLVNTGKSLVNAILKHKQLTMNMEKYHREYSTSVGTIVGYVRSIINFSEVLEFRVRPFMTKIDSFPDYMKQFGVMLQRHRDGELTTQKRYNDISKLISEEFTRLMIQPNIIPDEQKAVRGDPEGRLQKKKVNRDTLMWVEQLEDYRVKYEKALKKERVKLEELQHDLHIHIFKILRNNSNYDGNALDKVGAVKISNFLIDHPNLDTIGPLNRAERVLIELNQLTKQHIADEQMLTKSLSDITLDIEFSQTRISALENTIKSYGIIIDNARPATNSQFQKLSQNFTRQKVAQEISSYSETEARMYYARYWEGNEARAGFLEHQLNNRTRVDYVEPGMIDVDAMRPAKDTPDEPPHIDQKDRQHLSYSFHNRPIKATIEELDL